ncbi:hypothetical protein [Hankyongella ginsenosidimutans]|uniref:hypothetical protein n=1 Tax=Hankyongella ginsenosidimutans TaxID=1763828 RepID=UPI001CA36E78|nr:hypothetical protein [Hankyongella ginsenosidimutans]
MIDVREGFPLPIMMSLSVSTRPNKAGKHSTAVRGASRQKAATRANLSAWSA